jgi:hypothetical protein
MEMSGITHLHFHAFSINPIEMASAALSLSLPWASFGTPVHLLI